jgi:alpha-D-xyloside xylohydrolase
MMRPMVMDFNDDSEAVKQSYQYMFGKSFLVAPITEAGVKDWNVYLPKAAAWYDFWTGKRFEGGQSVKADAPLDKLPLFVKAGSIVPMGDVIQYTEEKPADNLEIRVFKGADGEFALYEDEGDNYNYEKGNYAVISFSWNEAKKVLTINDRKGSFAGMLADRKFNIVMVDLNKGASLDKTEKSDKVVAYKGKKVVVKF